MGAAPPLHPASVKFEPKLRPCGYLSAKYLSPFPINLIPHKMKRLFFY